MRKLSLLATMAIFVSGGVAFAQHQGAGDPPSQAHQVSYPPYGYRVFTDWQPSNVRIDVSPADAQVFVDTTFAGYARNFNGTLQRLSLHAGPHLMKIRKPGFRTLVVEMNLYPGQAITYAQTMEPSHGDEETLDLASAPAFEEGAFLPASDAPAGDLRFDMTPKGAAIYADGFYVGTVDDFNGSQHMMLTQGRHHLVLQRNGYDTLEADVTINSVRATYRAVMQKPAAH